MLVRWAIYFREMFNPLSRMFFALISCVAVLFAAQALHDENSLLIGYPLLLGTVSYFLIMLYYRLCDEFKDYDTDVAFFPERPVPSGRVLLSDLKVLLILVSLIMIAANTIWNIALPEFLALYLFAFFMGKWFFMENFIAKNRLLAFVTHAPVSFFGGFYLLALYANPINLPLLTPTHWLIVAWLSLPGFIWEIVRKTRAPEEEEENYQTYSIILGYRTATIIALLMVCLEWFFFWKMGVLLQLSPWVFLLMGMATLSLSLLLILFVLSPRHYSRYLRPAVEIYGAVCLLVVIVDLMIARGFVWSL